MSAKPRLFNLARHALAAAGATPEKAALVIVADPLKEAPAEVWSYGALERAVLSVASGLQALGLEPGGRILIRLPNTSSYAILFLGAIAGGFVPVPVSSLLTADEVGVLLADSEPCAVALAEGLAIGALPPGAAVIEEARIRALIEGGHGGTYAETAAEDPAFLVYTSGTTARPKGVLHAQRSLLGRRPMYEGWYGITAGDRMLHAGAFNWTFTLGTGLSDPLANGATAIVYTGPKDPSLWPRLVARHGATMLAAVPSLYRQILKYGEPERLQASAFRHGLAAGEALTGAIAEEWQARSGAPIFEALGMTEISTYISTGPGVPRREGTSGKPQPGRRIAVLREDGPPEPCPPGTAGLLAVDRRDPGLMLGYWRRPEEEAPCLRGEWFTGGDLASIDEAGYVTHLGRADDVMKVSGYRVSPHEIEAVLARHPAVAEAACTEVLARNGLRVIAAFIVPRPGTTPDRAELAAHAETHLAPYKRPREIVFLDSLPVTANGKVKRKELRLP